jgi:uncharacterized membrane protein YwzB
MATNAQLPMVIVTIAINILVSSKKCTVVVTDSNLDDRFLMEDT